MAKLKQYLTESEITDDLKGAYTKDGDRYKLNDLDSSHSLVVAQAEVTDKADKRQKEIDKLNVDKGNLERERDEYKNKSIPHGFRAVSREIAELGEAVKNLNLSKDEISGLKTKVDEYEKEKAESEGKALKTRAFQSAGVTNTDLALSLRQSDDLNFESETKDGKEIFYRVTEKDGKKEKTLFDANYLKAADGFKDVFDKLTITKQKITPFPDKETETFTNLAEKIRADEKKRAETAQVRTVDEAFGRAATTQI